MENWRDVYEEKNSRGHTVVHVVGTGTGRHAYLDEKGELFSDWNHYLIEKPKPKKYRPFTRSEIKCGDVFRHKSNGVDYMIAVVGDCYVKFANDDGAIDTAVILEKYTKPDGSPAGMLKE